MTGDCSVRVQFYRPPEPISRYFTTFYLTEISVPDGRRVTDHLHPEWANLRLCQGDLPDSELPGLPIARGYSAIVTGPTSTTVRFTVGTSRVWGIGFLPLGWARFMGEPASIHADRIYDAHAEPFLAPMRSLVQYLFDPSLHWIGAMDSSYHDQAQFVRDFHRFMGMSPSEYAASPRPVLEAVMRARQQRVGTAVQALHAPAGS